MGGGGGGGGIALLSVQMMNHHTFWEGEKIAMQLNYSVMDISHENYSVISYLWQKLNRIYHYYMLDLVAL